MKKIYFLILIQLHIYDIFAQESIPYPVVNDDCNACELWNHFRDSIFFNFSGGNLCCEKKNYIPVLIDEFEGTELDLNKWATHYCHTDYYNPNCLDTGYTKRIHKNNGAYFKDENVTVGNGICTLRTIKELTTFPTYCFKDQCVSKREYSSGMIMSRQWFQNFHSMRLGVRL